jgi:DNA (cytosine-5)-methyltransferase 1
VQPNQKVSVFEALADLDFIGNDEEFLSYRSQRSRRATPRRLASGAPAPSGKTYAEWSRQGRLPIPFVNHPTYVQSGSDYEAGRILVADLHNHKTSNHNAVVEARMKAIQDAGGWTPEVQEQLGKEGIGSEKRDYRLLNPDAQAPTVMTIADDYVHYKTPRALTVREMARLQSFDDSFVFQGKRSTGGDKRKNEVPQFTLVGNAVPPLLARAIGDSILSALSHSEMDSRKERLTSQASKTPSNGRR